MSLIGPLPAAAAASLIDALGVDDGDIRWAAAERLKQLAARESRLVIPELLRLAADGSAEQRKMALYCLRDLDVGEAVEVAQSALRADDVGVRLAALSAFARLADERAAAAEKIVALLKDADDRVRRAAAATLGTLGSRAPVVISALQQICSAEDPSLRRAAERSLKILQGG